MQFNIKVIRAIKGMTQSDLATLLGVSLPTIIKWEKDYQAMTVRQIKTLCEKVGIDYAEIKI